VRRRWLRALGTSLAVGVIAGIGLSPTVVVAASATSPGAGRMVRQAPLRATSVNLFGPGRASRANRPVPIAAPRRAPASAGAAAGSATSPTYTSANLNTSTSQPTLQLVSRDRQVASLGRNQLVAPPDTMVAAGPSSLLEAVNRSISAWTKAGQLLSIADLDVVLPMPAGFTFSDPRLFFDAPSQRFFLTGVAVDAANDSLVFLAVSHDAQPGDGFFVYSLARTADGVLHDQPKPGVSSDKVVIAWDDFQAGSFLGSEEWIVEKSPLLTGGPASVVSSGPNLGRPSPVPAQSLDATSAVYVAYNGGSYTGVLTVTGRPVLNNVAIVETDLATPVSASPPPATESGGGTVETGDRRYLSASWRAGSLWIAGSDACRPQWSLAVRACIRLVQVSTATGLAVVQALDLGLAGYDLFMPAVTVSSPGGVYLAGAVSSPNMWPGVGVVTLAAGQLPATFSLVQGGLAATSSSSWGDYSSISLDPSGTSVWPAGEYSGAGASLSWGTATAQFPI